MRVLNESICWTNWVDCFNEWTLIYIIILNIALLALVWITIILSKRLSKKE